MYFQCTLGGDMMMGGRREEFFCTSERVSYQRAPYASQFLFVMQQSLRSLPLISPPVVVPQKYLQSD